MTHFRPIHRMAEPLFAKDGHERANKARQLETSPCCARFAVKLNRLWHSRLPHAQAGPWMYAFHSHYDGVTYAVALWHNPSARGLPESWVELRRMAIADDAPKYTATRMLGAMARWFRRNTHHDRLISYQDTHVHQGTIYKAANWKHTHTTPARNRNRTVGLATRRGRLYRSDANGDAAAGAEKYRWEYAILRREIHDLFPEHAKEGP